MTGQDESRVRLAGRLFAAVTLLRYLAKAGGEPPPAVKDITGKTGPAERIREVRPNPYDCMRLARGRGEPYWGPAASLFDSLTGFLKHGPIPDATLDPPRQKEFAAGYAAQLADFRERFPGLLE
ncbi:MULTISPECIES: hypothetical protein [unclassified Streptomyces]|uniref:hypothetical protein n=1 Tax=unclassified Streptomyces TaxID=2593676 RepID=UPI000B847297|nr:MULTISPECIES: hypothetical protein [unclassified Streptomyces]